MIAFSKNNGESEEQIQPPVVIASPPFAITDEATMTDEVYRIDAPKAQRELAMLHRALMRCGLIQSYPTERN